MASSNRLCFTRPTRGCVRFGPFRSVRYWRANATFSMLSPHQWSIRGTMLGRVVARVLLIWVLKAEAAAPCCLVGETPRLVLCLQGLKVAPGDHLESPSPLVCLNPCATIMGLTLMAPTKFQVCHLVLSLLPSSLQGVVHKANVLSKSQRTRHKATHQPML